MSRTPAAHLARLKIRWPQWLIGATELFTGETEYDAVLRDDPARRLAAPSLGLLEHALERSTGHHTWRPR